MAVELDPDYEAFVRARLPHLLKFARALTLDDHAAADLVQDALEKVLRRWSRLDGDPDGYARRIMVNQRVSTWRKVRRERVTADPPDRVTFDSEVDHELLGALRALPRGQRAVIALRFLEDLTEARTAEVLGCSVGTVKSQSARAMATLRTLLEGVKA